MRHNGLLHLSQLFIIQNIILKDLNVLQNEPQRKPENSQGKAHQPMKFCVFKMQYILWNQLSTFPGDSFR